MKTLRDTGLMPNYKFAVADTPYTDVYEFNAHNDCLETISALPILTIVQKAVEMRLVVIKKCRSCGGQGVFRARLDCEDDWQCPTCSGSGVVVEEG